MARRLALAIGVVVILASNASASMITIRANDYPLGTDLSTMFDGVRLSHFTNQPNSLGEDFRETYWPIAAPVLVSSTYHLPPGVASIGRFSVGLVAYESCRGAGSQGSYGCDYGYDVLEVLFAAPTNYIQIIGYQWSDGPGLYAYDVAGNRLNLADNFISQLTPATPPQPSEYMNLIRVARPAADIARVVWAGFDGNSTPTEITYHVAEPSTLLMLSIGALALVRRSKQIA